MDYSPPASVLRMVPVKLCPSGKCIKVYLREGHSRDESKSETPIPIHFLYHSHKFLPGCMGSMSWEAEKESLGSHFWESLRVLVETTKIYK